MIDIRVYDTVEKIWLGDDVYLDVYNDLYVSKKYLFGLVKLIPDEYNRYIMHKPIDLYDKNGILIHEGDYLRAQVDKNEVVTGVVAYAQELAGYIILCSDINKYYVLSSQICEHIEVVGNVFDGIRDE